ncbi:sigma-70 family RNA polymerase sigma factor [Massilia pinisoli]|uniref:Sigma-70 family RNA polymerase sigma factor n=1 Tax=Massilia pinisoli TaxID=1772194 RepID=A0ABT1ZXN0_9BURK|nr:sigma-70 family RNA polymerase sigma factor [Massilia pinisoli]MCS0584697.1 sigma-70 family RNA polymerase sigma factor [Massilia pinisoli]
MSTPSSPVLALDLERLRPRLHRYCARMVGSVLDGEDVVQDALVRALESSVRTGPIDNPEGWLFRIAHNLALDLLRRRVRTPDARDGDDIDLVADPVDERARRDAAAASLPAFMHLPPSQRSVVILFDVLDYSAEEIGAILETTVPAVKSALQRGRAHLRELGDRPAPDVVLPDAERSLLHRYVDLFNARDFDALREMLAADVRLDLVNRLRLQGAAVDDYFTRYGQVPGWTAWAGIVEGRPAVLVRQNGGADATDYIVVLDFTDGRVAAIRDFVFARYVMQDTAYIVTRDP